MPWDPRGHGRTFHRAKVREIVQRRQPSRRTTQWQARFTRVGSSFDWYRSTFARQASTELSIVHAAVHHLVVDPKVQLRSARTIVVRSASTDRVPSGIAEEKCCLPMLEHTATHTRVWVQSHPGVTLALMQPPRSASGWRDERLSTGDSQVLWRSIAVKSSKQDRGEACRCPSAREVDYGWRSLWPVLVDSRWPPPRRTIV